MILVARVTGLSYQRVFGIVGMQPAKFSAGAHGGESAIEGVRVAGGKKKTRKPGSVAVVILTASTRINHDCGVDCAWKNCCTIPYRNFRSSRVEYLL